jgi:hypothetical protein
MGAEIGDKPPEKKRRHPMGFPFEPNDDGETSPVWYRSSRVLAVCVACILILGLLGLGRMFVQSHEAVPEPGLPVAGDAPQEAASNAAAQPNPPTSKTIEATATAASPKSADETAPAHDTLPTQYVDETYGGTYHRRANGRWEVVDNASRRVVRIDKEVSRTADFVELLTQNPPPNQQFRLFPDRIERMVNGKWQWIANGYWATSSGAVPSVTSKMLEVFGEKYAATGLPDGSFDSTARATEEPVELPNHVLQMSMRVQTSRYTNLVVQRKGRLVQMTGCRFVRISDAWIHTLPFVGREVNDLNYPFGPSPFVGTDSGNLVRFDEKDYRKWCGFYVYDRDGALFQFAFAQKDKHAQALLDLKEGTPVALKGIVVQLRASRLAGHSVIGKYGLICTEIKY